MIVVIDTREQKPFTFAPGVQTEVATLNAGDYSVKGMTSLVTVERKSLSDLFGTCGAGRERFERELHRMADMQYAAIVIEAGWHDIVRQPPHMSQVSSKVVVRSLLAWSERFNVHVYAAHNRQLAARLTFILLERFWIDTKEGKRNGNRCFTDTKDKR